jgi:hypothetical protein
VSVRRCYEDVAEENLANLFGIIDQEAGSSHRLRIYPNGSTKLHNHLARKNFSVYFEEVLA